MPPLLGSGGQKHFAEDRQIRCWTAKSLFLQQVQSGAVSCYTSIEGHDRCNECKQWIEKYAIDARRIADLLDEHIPGSKGTSLYIRAVCRLIDPFLKIDFGSPAEIQASVSSAITIIRLWRRVLELKEMLLHSKPGAKTDPSKHGKFMTNGCYITTEILFEAATLYPLAMFLHFRDVGLSLFNTVTKSTVQIISEPQVKTNEIESLDSQPTLAR